MQTFSKAERLCSKVLIDILVETGRSFNSFPFRITWRKVEEGSAPVQVLITVPKRIYKRAVDRNLLKRRIRESYRKNKMELYANLENKKIHLMLIYTSKTIVEQKEIEGKVMEALNRLYKEVNT